MADDDSQANDTSAGYPELEKRVEDALKEIEGYGKKKGPKLPPPQDADSPRGKSAIA